MGKATQTIHSNIFMRKKNTPSEFDMFFFINR